MTKDEYVATLEQALQKKAREWCEADAEAKRKLAEVKADWRQAYAAYAKASHILQLIGKTTPKELADTYGENISMSVIIDSISKSRMFAGGISNE